MCLPDLRSKLILFTILSGCFLSITKGQSIMIDSARMALQQSTARDSNQVKAMIFLSKEFYRAGHFDEALHFADSAKGLAKAIHYEKGIGHAWLASGYALYRKSEYDQALKHFDEAKAIFKPLKRKGDLAKAYLYRGQVFDVLSHYDSAFRNYTKALKLLDGTDDRKSIASILNSMGINYFNRSNYELALQYFYRSLEISEALNEKRLAASTFNNLGAAYEKMEQYEDALKSYHRALPLVTESGNKTSIALAKSNIGGVYVALKKFEEAEQNIREAVQIQDEIHDRRGLVYAYSNFGSLYAATGDHQAAEHYFSSAINLAKEIGDAELSLFPAAGLAKLYMQQGKMNQAKHHLESARKTAAEIGSTYWLQQNYLLTSEYDSARGHYQQAYHWYKQYTMLNDSIFNPQKSAQIAEMQALYESEKKDLQIRQLEEAKSLDELKNTFAKKILWVVISAISLVISGLAYIVWDKSKTATLLHYQKDEIARSNEELKVLLNTIQKQTRVLSAQNEKLEEMHREKDGFVSIIAHDLRSPLNKATGLAGLIAMCGPVNEEQKDILAKIKKVCGEGNQMIQDLMEINLVESTESEVKYTTVQLPKFIREILFTYTSQTQLKKLEIYFESFPNRPFDVLIDAHYLTRIVDNLISNAIKFSPVGARIYASLMLDDNNIHFTVRDEGQGIREEEMTYLFKKFKKLSTRPTAGESSTGLGLSIVKLLTEKMQGTIAVESIWGKGATFKVNIPVKVPE